MRTLNVHDLVVTTSTLAAFILCTIALQIVVITKSTIPADEVITEIRIMRREYTRQHELIDARLADLEAILGNEIAKQNTLEQIGNNYGFSTN